MEQISRGVIYVHSAPAVLRPHIEWAISAVLKEQVKFEWTIQPADPKSWRTEYEWVANQDLSDQLTAALLTCQRIRFEVTLDAQSELGQRYMYTPQLGLFRATTDQLGEIVVTESRLRSVFAKSTGDSETALAKLLGTQWDAELDVFRYAGQDATVRWLHRVS